MRIWKRLLNIALCLCLCLCVELLPVTARAAAALPVTISTSGNTYQYAKGGVNLSQLAYGTATVDKSISEVTTAPADNGGAAFTVSTGWNRNFKLIYKEIPVKVTVPANTEYTVTFSYIFSGSYHQHTGQTTAKFAAQAIYLGENGASADVTFHTAAGSEVKTTRDTSEVANVHSVTVTNGNKAVEKPGSSNGSVFTAKFRNDTAAQRDVTRYFGCWAACGDDSENPSSMTLNFTLVPVTAAYTVTLDPDGGNVSSTSKQVTLGGQYGDLPTPTKSGSTFIGWYTTAKTGGTKVGRYDALVSNATHTLYARWSETHEHGSDPDGSSIETFTDIDYAKYTTDGKLASRAVYYPADRRLDKAIYLKEAWSTRANYYLCLNGKKITDMTGHTVVVDSGLNTAIYICDCQGGGEIVNPLGRIDYIFSTGETKLYLYGGTFRGTNICQVTRETIVDGAALYATDTAIRVGKYNSGYTVIKSGTVSSSGPQAVDILEGQGWKVYILGGTIENTGSGCAIHVGKGKRVCLSGSPTITGKSCDILLDEGGYIIVGELTGVFSVGLSNPALVTPDKPWTIAVGSTASDSDYYLRGEGNPAGHFVLPDGPEYKDLYLKEDGKDANGKPIVQVCRYDHKHTGGTATCTEWGKCTGCGTAYLEPLGHDIVKHSGQDPTCTKPGCWAYETCSRCDYTTYQTIPANGHKYGALVLEKPATCTAEGMKAHYQCADCKKYFDESKQETTAEELKIPLAAHQYGDFTVDKQPTCTENGSQSRHCSRCDAKTDVMEIPAEGHKEVIDAAVAPTCTQTGLTEGKHCSVCNTVLVKRTIVEKLPHRWDEGVETKAPTCTEAGVKTFTCSQCHNTKTEPISALGHDWGAWNVMTPATETTEGSETRTCQRDGNHTETRSIPKLDHTHTMVHHSAVDADCGTGTPGNIEYWVCSGCKKVFSDKDGAHEINLENTVIPPDHNPSTAWSFDESSHWYECKKCKEKLDFAAHDYDDDIDTDCNICGYSRTITPPHTHSLTLVPAIQATCSSVGNREHYRCTDCDKLFRDDAGTQELTAEEVVIEKLSHTPEPIPAVPATCEQSGMTEGSKCSVCQEVITAQTTIPALNHDWQEATCETPKTCTRCHVTQGKALGHDWGRYIVTTPATETSEGVETRTCQRNDAHKQTRPIPKLPASTYGVSGEVRENGGDPAVGVTVTLVLGDRQIALTTTDSDGKYSFGNVAPGVYNLVAEKGGIIMTVKVEVISKDVSVSTIIMPQGKTNSVVEIKSDKPEENVEAVVGNLEKVFKTTGDDKPFTVEDQAVVDGGGSVEIKLTVTKTDENETSTEIKQELPANTKVGVRLELDVHKTVTPNGGNSTVTRIENTDVLLETIIRLPAELQGKDSYTVYRLHGRDVHALTAQKNTDGEFIEVSHDRTAITIHAKLYSEYVIAYQERGETGGNGGNTGGNGGNGNGGGHDDNDDGYTPPSVPARPETHTGYRACRRDDTCPIWPFADAAPTAWYHDGVHYCIEKGLMHGISADKFLPDGSVTRAQLAAILWRLEGNPAPVSTADFSDVADGAWYAGAVRWAADSGVVKGYADGRFRPNDAVTREQMAALLYRFAGYKGYDVGIGGDTDILRFTDGAAVGGYAVPAMRWACGSGLMTGARRDGGMALAPRDTTTRAQTATLLTRFQSTFAKEP